MKRSEVKAEHKWRLEDIFATNELWEKTFAWLKEQVPVLAAYKGKLDNEGILLEFLKENDKVDLQIERVYVYAKMRLDEDSSNDLYQGYSKRAEAFLSEVGAALSWVSPELNAIDSQKLLEWSNKPEYKDYDYQLQKLIRQKKYILSEKEERILALSGDALSGFADAFNMFDNVEVPLKDVIIDGKPQKLTHGSYGLFLRDDNQEVRKQSWFNMHEAFQQYINTISAIYAGNVKKSVFYARARGHEDCLSAAIFNENVPADVYRNLVAAVNDGTKSMHRYVHLRNKLMGGNIHMYDMYASLVKDAKLEMEYEDAYNLVVEALAPLGKDYTDALKKAPKEGWIDVHETENKRSGAYHWGCYDVHPFVLLNYQKNCDNIFTIAHEMGHAMHSFYTKKNQPYSKGGYAIFVAEVASTVNEVILLKHLVKGTKDVELKKYLLNYYLEMFKGTIFRQTMFAEFEATAHQMSEQGKPLTQTALCDLYYGLNQKYYGDGVIHDDLIRYEWARIPHFYRAFYVYKYATGLTSAVNIAANILKNGEPALKAYKSFLSAGSDGSPYDILKLAGVDLAQKAPYEAAFKEFEDCLNEFEALMSK